MPIESSGCQQFLRFLAGHKGDWRASSESSPSSQQATRDLRFPPSWRGPDRLLIQADRFLKAIFSSGIHRSIHGQAANGQYDNAQCRDGTEANPPRFGTASLIIGRMDRSEEHTSELQS